jgi:hypothetical protein
MNGPTYPCFLGRFPGGLSTGVEAAVPGILMPRFAPLVTENDTVYAYLPVEQIKNHVNIPMCYHLACDAIHLMTQKATKFFA